MDLKKKDVGRRRGKKKVQRQQATRTTWLPVRFSYSWLMGIANPSSSDMCLNCGILSPRRTQMCLRSFARSLHVTESDVATPPTARKRKTRRAAACECGKGTACRLLRASLLFTGEMCSSTTARFSRRRERRGVEW